MDLEVVLSALVWVVAVGAAILSAKKKGGEKGGASLSEIIRYVSSAGKKVKLPRGAVHTDKKQESEADDMFESDDAPEVTEIRSSISTLSKLFREDRSNDWLARQMKEESKRTVWNNFSDLGAQHDVLCDAKVLRMQHRLRHEENVVDDGVMS